MMKSRKDLIPTIRKKRVRAAISYIVIILLLWCLISYVYNHTGDFKQLTIVNTPPLLLLILSEVLLCIFNGLAIKYIAIPFKVHLTKREWFGLSVVTSFYNLITPLRAGSIAQAAYLKKKHKLRYTHFLASFFTIYVMTFFIGSLVGLSCAYLIYVFYGFFSWLLFLFFFLMFVFLSFILFFSKKFKKTKYRFVNPFIEILNGFHNIKKNKKVIFLFSYAVIVQILLEAIILLLQFKLFNVNLSIVQALFLSVLSYVSLMLAITPGGLGIREFIIVFSAKVIGVHPAVSIASSLLRRAAEAVVMFTLGSIFSYILFKGRGNRKEIKPAKSKKELKIP